MDTPKNSFKAALLRGETLIGMWSGFANATAAEIVAGAGYDWIMIDGEHSPNDLRTILAQLQAIEPYATRAVVRVPIGDWVIIKQFLDIGAQTLLVPMVESAEQARTIVRAARYPPEGVRGIGGSTTRATRWGRAARYLHEANGEICLLVQMETRAGLNNLDEILAVDGVDGVFIGPSDLSASLGHLGNPGHPEMQAVIAGAIRKIVAASKPAGILTTDEAQARRYMELGCKFVAVGVDTTLLVKASTDLLRSFKKKD